MNYFRFFLFLASFAGLNLSGYAQKKPTPKALVKRTYYDYRGQQLHEEYQYISTPTNRYCKNGYYKEYNEDGTLWRKHNYRNNKAEGRQLEYYTTDNETWLEYDIMVHNDLRNGPYVKYAGPGDKRESGSYKNGKRAGQWIEYGSDGSKSGTYYVDDEPYTGTIDEYYANDTLRSSVEYYKGYRSGTTATWYPSGKLKSAINYSSDKPDGPTANYLENGKPDEATRIMLAEQAATQRTDSIQRAHADAVVLQRATRKRDEQDSVRKVAVRAEEDRQAENKLRELGARLLTNAQRKQAALAKVDGAYLNTFVDINVLEVVDRSATRTPQKKLYVALYNQLMAEYETASTTADKVSKAQRLSKLMDLAVALYRGEQPELNKAIRKEEDLAKVLTLAGL